MMNVPSGVSLNASLSGQYTVLEAATGEETLAVTVSGRPDVIILDLGLPDIDGVESHSPPA